MLVTYDSSFLASILITRQAWKVDLSLQLELNEPDLTQTLANRVRDTTVTDSRLLGYVYRLLIESARRYKKTTWIPSTLGDEGLKVWDNAAKGLKSGRERFDLWNTLFKTAMREYCWEDVRAVLHHSLSTP